MGGQSGGVRYPDVVVPLVGEDGNAFAILGRVQKAMRRAGVSSEEMARFEREATSDDYDHLITTVMRWVTVVSDVSDAEWDNAREMGEEDE